MQETKIKKKENGIEETLIDMASKFDFAPEEEGAVQIDQTKYGQTSVQAVMIAKKLAPMFADDELFSLFGDCKDKDEEMKKLQAVVAAQAYKSQTDDKGFHVKLKEAAKTGSVKNVLDLVAAHNYHTMSKETLNALLEDRVSSLLSNHNKLASYDHTFEELSGKLGSGLRVSSKDNYYEHRNIGSNFSLRIYKEGETYKTILHAEKMDPKDDYGSFDKFYKVCRQVLGITNKLTESGINSQKFHYAYDSLKSKIKETTYKINETDAKVLISINTKDNLSESQKTRETQKIVHNTEVGVTIGSFTVGMIASFFVPIFNPALLFITLPMAVFGLIDGPAAENKKGFFETSLKKAIDDNYKKKYLKDERSLNKFVWDYTEYQRLKDYYESTKLRIKAQHRFNAVKETFSHLRNTKGFVAEFESKSLDDIYLKSYAIIERLKQIE